MTEKVYFSERAIRANEKQVRAIFVNVPANADPVKFVAARFGKDMAPIFVRKMLEEINRGTDTALVHVAIQDLISWMIAMTVASVRDDADRMMLLGMAIAAIQRMAIDHSMGTIEYSSEEGAGEAVGGHA